MTFDQWRDNYNKMSLDEQIRYHNAIESQYPEQAHYTYPNVIKVLQDNINVLEFGSWKADLAASALKEFNIKSWAGIEICTAAILSTKCKDERFKYILPKSFNWFETDTRPYCDVVIATHFIEHLSNEHFESLVKYCAGVKTIYFEAPLTNEGESWNGYIGTHKLNYGWDKVSELMALQGYSITHDFIEGKIYSL